MRCSRAVVASLAVLLTAPTVRSAEPRWLRDAWLLQSSDRVAAAGEAVSQPGFRTEGWHAATVPATVLAALVAAGVHPDPYFGMNLRSIPGASYPIAKNFALVDIPADSPFRGSWWYRTEFDLPASMAGPTVWLRFDGINYRANVWLNGRRVAGKEATAGAFRRYELDVSPSVRLGARNALAVEVFPPGVRDLAFNWVDWNPAPPDKNMGLWGPVSLVATGPVAVRHPYVTSRLDLPSLDRARLTVAAEVRNATDRALTARVQGTIESIHFGQDVALGPNETKTVRFTPEQVPELNLARPRLWWPYQLGSPELYDLRIEAAVAGDVSDVQAIRFGVREVGSELTEKGHRVFKVNGRRILIRGGGWASDMLLRASPQRLEAELRYVREMNLNTVRLEGKLETDEFFERADQEGILVMAGWCCCDHWEDWANGTAENRAVATASLRDQALRLRAHPSVFVWLNGSDGPPPPDVEKAYLDVLREVGWPKPVLSSATDKKSPVSGPSGVKMTGPYDYVPPSYWLTDKQHGGAFGFNTETSPGPAVPPIESLEEMLPAEHLWPIDEVWAFHAGGNEFDNLKLFTAALEARYGKASGAEDYARKAQALAYEGQRAMFEAYGRNKYTSTGVDPVDAQQRLAFADLAPLRLLPASRRRLLRDQEGLRAPPRAVLVRRPLDRRGERPSPPFHRAQGFGPRLRPAAHRALLQGCRGGRSRRRRHPRPRAASAPGPDDDLFRAARPAGVRGRADERELLLAFDGGRCPRLGKVGLVFHAGEPPRRSHRPGPTSAHVPRGLRARTRRPAPKARRECAFRTPARPSPSRCGSSSPTEWAGARSCPSSGTTTTWP